MSASKERKDVELIYIYTDQETGEKRVEAFIDLLDIDRSQHPLGGCFSVRFQAWRNSAPYDMCPQGVHDRACCKCHLPVLFVGQDECIFKSYSESKFVWVLGKDEGGEVRGMRKKGNIQS